MLRCAERGAPGTGSPDAWMHGKSPPAMPLGHFGRILGFFCTAPPALPAIVAARRAPWRIATIAGGHGGNALIDRATMKLGAARKQGEGELPLFRAVHIDAGRVKKYKKTAKPS